MRKQPYMKLKKTIILLTVGLTIFACSKIQENTITNDTDWKTSELIFTYDIIGQVHNEALDYMMTPTTIEYLETCITIDNKVDYLKIFNYLNPKMNNFLATKNIEIDGETVVFPTLTFEDYNSISASTDAGIFADCVENDKTTVLAYISEITSNYMSNNNSSSSDYNRNLYTASVFKYSFVSFTSVKSI